MNKEKINIQIGHAIKSCREMKGLSQSDVGKALGVTYQQIQKYEKGFNRISASSLVAFLEHTGMSLSTFDRLHDIMKVVHDDNCEISINKYDKILALSSEQIDAICKIIGYR